ncbi:MAG: 3-deoxy-8-phosphooctulonate synthase [Bacteroidales bacterium]|nr:3-deoxy-8-phosphooctulonate synthase [Bacteroidales bacterium]MBR2134748.1 3-deoxy-8-phosphooctulonate synthase [Bacteroidales bacterium]
MENLQLVTDYNNGMFFLMAGPCVIEGEEITWSIARKLKDLTSKYKIPFIFKASYKKANRSKITSFTGIGDREGLALLQSIRKELGVAVVTDIHSTAEAELAASYDIDVLQIPAFLCRQTELLQAAAATGKWVNIKKGQFLSPEAMVFALQKVKDSGNPHVMLTERGSQFGYSDLVVDFRSIPKMQKFGCPVVMDVTHSLQKPNQVSGVTGGEPELIPHIARAAVAVGADGLFMETHPDPAHALSDGANMLNLSLMDNLLAQLVTLRNTINGFNAI